MEGFDYVIKRPPQARICFGSTINRDVIPLKGPAVSSFMRRTMPKSAGKDLAPGSYNITYHDEHPVLTKLCSNRGYGPLSATTIRFKFDEVSSSPGVGEYDTTKIKPVKVLSQPFGVNVPRWKERPVSPVPGPGTYVAKHRKDIRMHSFGGRIKIIPATMTICKTDNFDRCHRCEEQPEIDYWKNFKSERSLCRKCMEKEVDDAKYRSKTKSAMMKRLEMLREFKRIRHCSYYHKHDKTSAAIQFVSNRDLKHKFRKENYLSMFE